MRLSRYAIVLATSALAVAGCNAILGTFDVATDAGDPSVQPVPDGGTVDAAADGA
jgi:hypothetical protein